MRHSDEELTNFILSAIREAALKEGIEIEGMLEECSCSHEEAPADTLEVDTATAQDFEPVASDEAEKVEIEEVKMLAEEFKRMRELVDFRSPLLRKD